VSRAILASVLAATYLVVTVVGAHADPPTFTVSPSSLSLPALTSNGAGEALLRPTFDEGYLFSQADSREIVGGTAFLSSIEPFDCDGTTPGHPCLLQWFWTSAVPSLTLRIAECNASHSDCRTLDVPVTIGPTVAQMPATQPASIDFGNVLVGTSVTRTVPVTLDPGFTVNSAGGGSPPFHFDFFTCDGGATGPCSVQYSFSPTSAATFHDIMSIRECNSVQSVCISNDLVPTAVTGTGVVHGTTSVSLSATPNPVRYGHPVTLTSTVTPTATGATPTGQVIYSDDGIILGAAPLTAADTASLVTSALHPGTNGVTATYSGDLHFAGSTSPTVTVTTTFDRCVGGSSGTMVVVATGEAVCVTGTHGGLVTVNRGGSLAIMGGFSGAIVATGAAAISICGSTISGAITISGSTGPVVLGSGQPWCTANRIGGDLTLRSNTDGVSVAGNTITGLLACTGNAPPPDDLGQRNTVVGARSGQCGAPSF
jgi:hypothetical protein